MEYNFDDFNNSKNSDNDVDRNFGDDYDRYDYPEKIYYRHYSANSDDELDCRIYEDMPPNKGKDMVAMSKKTRTAMIASIIVLFLLLSLFGGYFIYSVNNGGTNNIKLPWVSSDDESGSAVNKPENSGNVSINLEKQPEDENQMSAGQVYEKCAQSIVGVVVYDSAADIFSDPIGRGSGVIISEDGYIVTNSHVVSDSTKYGVKIVLNTSEEIEGKVLGIDKKTDLAVIKIEKNGLPKASFADSDQVKVGDWALAIGNPGAGDFVFDNSLTRGTISGLNRSLGGSQRLVKYIQTDAAINSGNSGGALLNMHGQVIGINSVKLIPSNYEGMGFAIPSNTVKSVVDSIIANGYVSGRVILGISSKMVSAYQAQIYNVPIGLIITKINSDSDINGKGIKTGDIIVKVNDINITGFDILSEEISKYKVGESVKLTIYRPSSDRSNYSTFDVNVKLIEDKGESESTASAFKTK